MMQKAIMLGMREAKYHPLEPMGRAIGKVLQGLVQLSLSDDFSILEADNGAGTRMDGYSLGIAYFEVEEDTLTRAQADRLIQYVREGGALLILHNGICFQDALARPLFPARFIGHPPYETMPLLAFSADPQGHEVMEGIPSFTLPEEAYMFEIADMEALSPFLWFEYEGMRYPAGWAKEYGCGRMVYLTPGHQADVCENQAFARLLQNAAKWTMGSAW